jgi:hypothetical protein
MSNFGKEKTCRFFTVSEFRALLNKLYPDEKIYMDVSIDGLYIGKGSSDDLPVEDLHERLAKAIGVSEVTSIHIDDYEPAGVWVAVKSGYTSYVGFKIDARYYAEVHTKTQDKEEILNAAKEKYYEANCGDFGDIDAVPVTIEDNTGNILWEA